MIQVESGGDRLALSLKGAMGLMQIMPDTWRILRDRYDLGADPYDPHDNIIAGAAYLRALHDRYGDAGFLAAYNAGPAAYDNHLATGQKLAVETQNYVRELARLLDRESFGSAPLDVSVHRSWTDAPLFSAQGATRLGSVPDTHTADWTGLVPQFQGLFVAPTREVSEP